MATEQEVIQFLRKWKEVTAHLAIDFVPRGKNIEGIKKLGITIKMAKKMLCELAVENYVLGPEKDEKHGTRDIWVFGLKGRRMEIYIKIKLYEGGGVLRSKCLSFHPAEYPLRYPFARR